MKVRNFRVLMALAALLSVAGPAAATGGFGCTIDDKALQLSIEGVTSRGMGGGLIQVSGEVTVAAHVLSDGFRKQTLERSDVTQYWTIGRDLKLYIYKESAAAPHETLDIVIETQRSKSDEMSYTGTYTAEASHFDEKAGPEAKVQKMKGRVTCSVE